MQNSLVPPPIAPTSLRSPRSRYLFSSQDSKLQSRHLSPFLFLPPVPHSLSLSFAFEQFISVQCDYSSRSLSLSHAVRSFISVRLGHSSFLSHSLRARARPTRKHEVPRCEPNGRSGLQVSVSNLALIVTEFFSAARSFAIRSPFDRTYGEP